MTVVYRNLLRGCCADPPESHRSICYLLRGCSSNPSHAPPRPPQNLTVVYGIYCPDACPDACAVACPDLRGKRVSTPAINLLNENPSLVALGKLTHTNPRATHEPTNQPSPAQPSHPHPPPSARTHEPMNKSSPAQPITIPGQPRSPKSLCITSHDGLHVLCTAPPRFSPYHI